MFKWLGSILGTEKALSRTIDAVSDGVDKMFYTDEEKAEAAEVRRKAISAVMLDWLKTTQGQNKARRVIALTVTFLWAIMYVVAAVLDFASVWVAPATAKLMTASAAVMDARADSMTGAMMLVLGFYFAAPHMEKWADKAMDRFSENKKGA